MTTRDPEEKVWLGEHPKIGDAPLRRRVIEQITAARTREIFEVVRKKLGNHYSPEPSMAGVLLTGGASMLPGRTPRDGCFRRNGPTSRKPGGWRDPRYSIVLGLLQHGLTEERLINKAKSTKGISATWRRLFG